MSQALEKIAPSIPHKKKAKPLKSLKTIFYDEWCHEEDYIKLADRLCDVLGLPDLTTRSGLKRVHLNLPNIQRRLDDTFHQAKVLGNTVMMGSVVAIYAKMCLVDLILQDKIVEKGFFASMVSLTSHEETHHFALRAINSLAFHAGKRLSEEFVQQAPVLVDLLRQNKHDSVVTSLVVGTFAHAPRSMCNRKISFDITLLAEGILEVLRSEHVSYWMFDHALLCMSSTVYDMPHRCAEIESYNAFRVALLRSKDIKYGMRAMASIIDTYGPSTCEGLPDINFFEWVTSPSRGELPSRLAAILDESGCERSVIYSIEHGKMAYDSICARYEEDEKLLAFGRSLARSILEREYAIPENVCASCRQRSCRYDEETAASWKWFQLAELCIAALRSQDAPNDRLYADVLEWRRIAAVNCPVHSQEIPAFAAEAIARHPACPFFYWASALSQSYRSTETAL